MPADRQFILKLIVLILVFGLVLAVWLVGVIMWSRRRVRRSEHLEERLGLISAQQEERVLRLWKDGREAVTTVVARRRPSPMVLLERALHQAGWEINASTMITGLVGLSAIMFASVYLFTRSVVWSGGALVLLLMLARMGLQRVILRRRGRLEGQLIDALELAARSLRAGHPVGASFQLVSEEIGDPISSLFGDIVQRQAMGVPVEQAVSVAAQRAGSVDLNLFAVSLAIQIRSGGNLADMMDRLASVIRDRRRLGGRVRVLTAQTQFSKRVLLIMPFALFVLLNVISPQYMEPLYTSPTGKWMLVLAGSGMLAGTLVMNRLAKLQY